MQYNEKILDHFRNPRNIGEIEDADVVGEMGNPEDGDLVYIYLKINKDKDIIEEISFQTFGCGAAIATSSMVTVMAKGKTLDEALKITKQDVAKELGGLSPQKMHCSNLASDALHIAIKKYRKMQEK